MSPNRLAVTCAIALLALGAPACGSDDEPEGDEASFELEALRDATACPVRFDASRLPDGLELGEPREAYVSEHGEGVQVSCAFPVTSSTAGEELETLVVAARPGIDAFAIVTDSGGSWSKPIYIATGVKQGPIEDAVDDLFDAEVEVLEGRGELLAVRNIEVDGAVTAFLLVYGGPTRTGEELEAVATALR